MATIKHSHSFTDHLSLYLPPFLRPSLPRDLRPPLPQLQDSRSDPSTPPPTPDRSELRDSARTSGEGTPDTTAISLNDDDQDSEEQGGSRLAKVESRPKKNRRIEEASKKSREGYQIALILTNSGSVARDHLASERTFLAYVRTSLATASMGVALVQLFTIANSFGTDKTPQEQFLSRFATPLGATLILFGLIILCIGCLRYFTIQTALTRGVFPAARLTITFIAVVGTTVTGIIFGVLIKAREGS